MNSIRNYYLAPGVVKEWRQLERDTEEAEDIPEEVVRPTGEDAEDYPYCKWVEKPGTPDFYPLSANVVGAGLTDLKIIACTYPRRERHPIQWDMIRHYSSRLVIDLTQLKDQKKLETRIGNFYPSAGQTVEHPGIKVEHGKTLEKTATYIKECYAFRNGETGALENEVTCLHYRRWPDGGVISLSELNFLVRTCLSATDGVIIHCLGGVGRTGTLVAALILHQKIVEGRLTEKNFNEQYLADLVFSLRSQRSKRFVSELGQFNLLFHYANATLKSQIESGFL